MDLSLHMGSFGLIAEIRRGIDIPETAVSNYTKENWTFITNSCNVYQAGKCDNPPFTIPDDC